MKISLEDKDLDAIASRVAKALVKKPPTGKNAAPKDDDDAGEDGEGGDFEDGEGEGEGDGEDGEGEGEEEEAAPDRDAVKAALTTVSKKFDQDAAMAILKKTGGVSALSKLPEAKFAAVIAACKKKAK